MLGGEKTLSNTVFMFLRRLPERSDSILLSVIKHAGSFFFQSKRAGEEEKTLPSTLLRSALESRYSEFGNKIQSCTANICGNIRWD